MRVYTLCYFLFFFIMNFSTKFSQLFLIYNTVWKRRDTTVIKASKDIMISFNGLDMKLTITSSTTEFTGSYKVVVSNEYGQDESSARLIVKVKDSDIFESRVIVELRISILVFSIIHALSLWTFVICYENV